MNRAETGCMRVVVGLLLGFFVYGGPGHASSPVYFENQKLTVWDDETGNRFGTSVALGQDTVLVGAKYDDEAGWHSGAVYVFVRDESGMWRADTKLVAPDAEPFDSFGHSVELDGDTALVGAIGDADNGEGSGSVYVFTRDQSGVWGKEAKLSASDGAFMDHFGRSLAIDGDTAIVGSQDYDQGDRFGAAYVFRRDATTGNWYEEAKLVPAVRRRNSGVGESVALQGNTAVVGAPGSSRVRSSAYVFVRDEGGTWNEHTRLLAPGGARGVGFGTALALDGDTVVIGAYGIADTRGGDGSAYVFSKDEPGNWDLQAKLWASDGDDRDRFGNAVVIDGGTIVVGSEDHAHDDDGVRCGAAYVFVQDGRGVWREIAELHPETGATDDNFGDAVSLVGLNAVVGTGDAAYAYDLTVLTEPPQPPAMVTVVADANGNGTRDFVVTRRLPDYAYNAYLRDGEDGSAIRRIWLGRSPVAFVEALPDVSNNGSDELAVLSMHPLREAVVRTIDLLDGSVVGKATFKKGLGVMALLPVPGGGDTASTGVAVVQKVFYEKMSPRVLRILKDPLTGAMVNKAMTGEGLAYAVIRDTDGNGVAEIVSFYRDSRVNRDTVNYWVSDVGGASFCCFRPSSPLFFLSIPTMNNVPSDELVVVGLIKKPGFAPIRAQVKDPLFDLGRPLSEVQFASREQPLAIAFVNHPDGHALAVLTETKTGKRHARVKFLATGEAVGLVSFPSNLVPHDFTAIDDSDGNGIPELLLVGENRKGQIKAVARDAATGNEVFRTNVP